MREYTEFLDLMNTLDAKKIEQALYEPLVKPKEKLTVGTVETTADAQEINKVEIDRLFRGQN